MSCQFEFLLTHDNMGLEIFRLILAKACDDIGYHDSILPFLAIDRVEKSLWHFEILTCESMGAS